jgi:hypothetical protein
LADTGLTGALWRTLDRIAAGAWSSIPSFRAMSLGGNAARETYNLFYFKLLFYSNSSFDCALVSVLNNNFDPLERIT